MTARATSEPAPSSGDYDEGYYTEMGNDYRTRLEFRLANFWRAVYIRLALHPGSVLDAGGGMGLLVERLRRWGCRAFGLELSHYAISRCPQETLHAFVQGSITALPFPGRAFDALASVNVFEHLEPEAVPQALRECARVARHGMYLEITVLEDAGVIHRDPTHRTKLRAREWLRLLRESLPGWQVRRGLHVPHYKNGIFILTHGREA